jgi:DNA-binding NarL/FixJ family response regulator
MATKLLTEFARQRRAASEPRAPSATLTEREKEVLGLLAAGKTNKDIAGALGIAENTVKNHLKNILEKLHLENRVQAATFALREGLLNKPPKKNG